MRLNENRKKRSALSLTPLIDVVFLLLIFFMLASTFLHFSAMPISGARGGGSSTTLNEIVLIQVQGADALSINGASVNVEGMSARIDELIAKGMTKAVVRPAKDSNVQDLVRILELARGTKLESVVVVR